MAREIFQNDTSDTLSASCTSGDTSITVTTGSKFPTTGNFRILVESEIMLVTARSSNTLTVVRGQEGTSAAAHAGSAIVTLVLTTGAVEQYCRDNVPLFNTSSRPPFKLLDSSGNALTSADFTGVNDSSFVTITDADDGSIVMVTSASGYTGYAIALVRSIPATQQLIAALRPIIQTGTTAGYMNCFIGFRESATGKLITLGPQNYNGAYNTLVRHWDSPTSINSQPFTEGIFLPGADAVWLKIERDGSDNLNFYVGDGAFWIKAFTETLTNFFTTAPDQFLFGTNAGNTLDIINRLAAWQEG